METNIEQWNEVATQGAEISLGDLDTLIKEWKLARERYEEFKKVATEANDKADALKEKVLATLQAAGKKKYHVDGLGLVYTSTKYTVPTPKDNGCKRLLFDYINNAHGPEALTAMLSIHHQTLNSFYNKEAEIAAKEGIADFSIPGLDQPVATSTLSFRAEGK